jgi:glycosyltransferase involved in cell wall biosynthesis
LLQIARRINLRRFDVTVIGSSLRDVTFERDVERMKRWGLRVILLPMHREIRPLQDLLGFLWLSWHFSTQNYDVVHTHCSKAGMLGRLAATVGAVRRVYHTPHTFAFQSPACSKGRAWLYRSLEQFAGLFTDKLVALSQAQQRFAVSEKIVNESRTLVIPNGISIRTPEEIQKGAAGREGLGLRERERVVGCVGRLSAQKGHEYLIAAAEIIARQRPEVSFLLVGDGERRRELEDEVSRRGLNGRVRFLGHRSDARNLYSVFDVLAMTSLYEGLPYTLLEAMADSCPVVVFQLPDLEELVVDGETGLVAAPGRVEEFAEKILRLLDDEELRKRLVNAARRRVEEHYSAEKFIQKIEALYAGELD